MDHTKLFLLLAMVACTRGHSGEHKIPIIQTWGLGPGHRLLPLTEVNTDCNNGSLVNVRISTDIDNRSPTDEKQYYLVNGGECTESRVTQLRNQLQLKLKQCYRESECESVDLVENYYTGLVESECSLCKKIGGCKQATVDLLLSSVSIRMGIVCKAILRDNQIGALKMLNKTGPTTFTRTDFPTDECEGTLEIQHALLANDLPKALVPLDSEQEEIESLKAELMQCLLDSGCQSISIQTEGSRDANGKVVPDYILGIFWKCTPFPKPITDVRGLTSQGQAFRTALIVVSLLLAITLLTLLICIFFVMRWRRRQSDNNNNPRNESSGGRQPQTLPKYQQSVQHSLEEHRYTDLTLRKQPSEDAYEYVDPDGPVPSRPTNTDIDADGYLIPQP